MPRAIGEIYTVIEWNATTGGREWVTYRVWGHRLDRRNQITEQTEIISRRPIPDGARFKQEPGETKHGGA